MSCNCKNKNKSFLPNGGVNESDNSGLQLHEKIIIFITKTIGFIFGGIILSIIIVPFSLYALFKIIYFEESIDITGGIIQIGKLLSKDYSGEHDFEDEEINIDEIDSDDYELVGVDDITDDFKKSN